LEDLHSLEDLDRVKIAVLENDLDTKLCVIDFSGALPSARRRS